MQSQRKQLHTTHLLSIIALEEGTYTAQHNAFPAEDVCYFVFLHDLYLAFHSLNLLTNESYSFSPSPPWRLRPYNRKAINQRTRMRKWIR